MCRRTTPRLSRFAEPVNHTFIRQTRLACLPVNLMDPNPMQVILRRQMGLDVFALDGDDTVVQDTWQDRARPREPEAPVSMKR